MPSLASRCRALRADRIRSSSTSARAIATSRPKRSRRFLAKAISFTVHKWLYQEGQFAAKETVTLIGPRSRVISNLRILGPCRNLNQVELAYTDSIALGFDIPLRASGDIKGTPGAMLMGPAGFFEMPDGVIRALRHAHLSPADADFYGVKHGDFMKLKIGGDCGITLDKMLCRVDKSFKLEVHIDTDEGNACNLQPDTPVELTKINFSQLSTINQKINYERSNRND